MKNKISIIILFFSIFCVSTSAQKLSKKDSIQQFADSTFKAFEKLSLYGDKVNWSSKKQVFQEKNKNFKSIEDIILFFQNILDETKDNHTFFWYKNKKYASNFGQLDESKIRKPLMDALEAKQNIVLAKIIDDIGYIRIPQDNTSDDFAEVQKSAENIQKTILKIYKPNLKGWIIDLRLNSGGNMYPMILGLSPFIEDGTFASTIDRNKNIKKWSLKNNAIFDGDKKITELSENILPDLKKEKIVILTSQITGSSGEITALSFLNRPETVFIGEETAGYMTSNELIRLPFETFLLLANAYEMDNNGNIIKSIKPNKIIIDGDNFIDLKKDIKVLNAVKWIKIK